MTITNILLVWALSFVNLGNYKSFNDFNYTVSPLKIADNKAFVFNEKLVKTIKIDTATQIAKFKLPFKPISSPVCKDGVLYYSSSKGFLLAYSIKEAKILWKKSLETTNYQKAKIYNDLLISYTNTNELKAFDILTGKKIWSYTKDLSRQITLNSRLEPIIYKNFVIVAMNNYLSILNAMTGIPIIEKTMPINPKEIINSIKIFKENILLSTNKGHLLYLNIKGKLIWKYRSDYFVFETRQNEIILATKDNIVILNSNGIKISDNKIPEAFPYDIKIVNNAIAMATSKGIRFWDLGKNKIVYEYKNNTGIKSIFISNNMLIALSNKGIHYAFKIFFSNKV